MGFGLMLVFSFAILLRTGWFGTLRHQAGVSETSLFKWLGFTALSLVLPPFPDEALWQIHPGFIWLAGLLTLGWKQGEDRSVLAMAGLGLGASLFLLHEVAHVEADWENVHYRAVMAGLSSAFSLVFARKLKGRLTVATLGLLSAHTWILWFHRESLKPLTVGSTEFLDAVWLALASVFSTHLLWEEAREKLGRLKLSIRGEKEVSNMPEE